MPGMPNSPHVRECPYCGVRSQFHMLGGAPVGQARTTPRNEQSPLVHNKSAMYYCNNCGCTLFVRAWGDGEQNVDIYPRVVPEIPKELPVEVAEVYKEALLCHSVRAWNATAVMCRRAIQEVVVLLKAEGKTLYEQIEFLSRSQTIALDLRDWAHEVRLIGKDGAHADVPKDVTEDDANEAVEFATQFLNYIYVLKERLRSRKSRMSTKP